MPVNKDPATPPMIGKIGPYTVFVTPPPTPKPSFESSPVKSSTPVQPPHVKSAPPVLPPPVQYEKSGSAYGSKFGFFWDAVAKVQNAHSSLDDSLARWFGLNQSKYQWALDDYYEKNTVDQVDAKVKDVSAKAQSV
ncbi:hypothetical protein L1987_54448 [Smallanthus sonchifolius]|uniref:Uncharacterized protein n=1 Tax=Smallanthus sonchifolius TaxID=185202 RepID=A0ACB9E889_9ASTR|nr:hypothetical protein L1987_54448 [Smallanthus sonchifolius]